MGVFVCVCMLCCVIVTAGYAVLFGHTFGDWAYVVGRSVCVSWTDVNFCVWIYFACRYDILARRESRLYLVSIIKIFFFFFNFEFMFRACFWFFVIFCCLCF